MAPKPPIRYVLITRPEAEDTRLADEIAARGLAPLPCPMLRVTLRPESVPDLSAAQAVVFTSAQAVRAVVQAGRVVPHIPVYAVGEKTAHLARMAGFTAVTAPTDAAGGMAALVVQMAQAAWTPENPVYHLSGRDIAAPVALPGVTVQRYIVYEADKVKEFPPAAAAALRTGTVAAALFLSARTGEAFAQALAAAGLTDAVKPIKSLCISDSVLQSVRHLPWRGVAVADAPRIENIIALLDDPAL